MRVVVIMMMIVVVVTIIVAVMVAVVMMRFVMLLIIVVSFRHRTKSNSCAERQKGNKGSLHILLEYGWCEVLGRV